MPMNKRKRILSSVAALFLTALLISYWAQISPLIIVLLYFSMTAITFITYAIDKSRAKHNKWRIKEVTLHVMSLIGGWPGAILGQEFLRHKTVKGRFRIIFYMTVLGNLFVLALLYSRLLGAL